MSIKALNWAFDLHFDIPSHKLVMLALADNATNEGLSYPFIKTIASKSCIKDIRYVQRILREFEEKGYITTEEHFKKGNKQTSNCYQLHMEKDFKKIEIPKPGVVCKPGVGWSTDQGRGGVQTTHTLPKTLNKSNENMNIQNHKNHQPKLITKANNLKQKCEGIVLPDWLNKNDWNDFKEFRKEKKEPLSQIAERRAINELEKLKKEGNDPSEVINQTIINNWRGLFAVKRANHLINKEKDTKTEKHSTVQEYGPGHPLWESNEEWKKKHGSEKERVVQGSARNEFCDQSRRMDMQKAEDYLL